jgi:hypothetical protein
MSEDDSGDVSVHRLDKRMREIELWQKLHERDHLSWNQKLDNFAAHIETDKQCSEIQAYLDDRKKVRDRQSNLLADVKRLIVFAILGLMWLVFSDGAKVRVSQWLTPNSSTGQHAD